MARKHIVIFGGGVSGLTVATQCVRLGYDVTLYEAQDRLGGKVLSDRTQEGLPNEHSIRAFGRNYRNLLPLLKSIPIKESGVSVLDNLAAKPVFTLMDSLEEVELKKLTIRTGFWNRIKLFVGLHGLLRSYGLTYQECIAFAWTATLGWFLLKLAPSKVNRVSFKQFAKFDRYSKNYSGVFTDIFGILTGARPNTSAGFCLRGLFTVFSTEKSILREDSSIYILNGPVHEQFIGPWEKHLVKLGVSIRKNLKVTRLLTEQSKMRRIESAELCTGEEIQADAFVLAVPYWNVTQILEDQKLKDLAINSEWSQGFQFYLSEIPDELSTDGFVFVFRSPWEVVFLVECPYTMSKINLPPGTKGVLSVSLSNVHRLGLLGKAFWECTADEILKELLDQIGLKNRSGIHGSHVDETLYYCSPEEWVDPAFDKKDWPSLSPQSNGFRWLSRSPIFVPDPGQVANLPGPKTRYENVFLAGEYTKTEFLLTTMESACESGIRCASSLDEYLGGPDK